MTASSTAMVTFILIGAFLLQNILALLGPPIMMSKWVIGLNLSQLELILFLYVLYIVLGMFMESFAMMVTTLPIILPMLNALYVDLVWFGIVVVILLELSLITPPVGMNLFVLQGVRMRPRGGPEGRRHHGPLCRRPAVRHRHAGGACADYRLPGHRRLAGRHRRLRQPRTRAEPDDRDRSRAASCADPGGRHQF